MNELLAQVLVRGFAFVVAFPVGALAADFLSPGISHQEVHAALGTPQALLVIDVRKPVEFGIGHVPGAVNIPHDELADRLDEVRNQHGVVVYCIAGWRTRLAEQTLLASGVENVFHLEGGFGAWMRDGFEVEKGSGR